MLIEQHRRSPHVCWCLSKILPVRVAFVPRLSLRREVSDVFCRQQNSQTWTDGRSAQLIKIVTFIRSVCQLSADPAVGIDHPFLTGLFDNSFNF